MGAFGLEELSAGRSPPEVAQQDGDREEGEPGADEPPSPAASRGTRSWPAGTTSSRSTCPTDRIRHELDGPAASSSEAPPAFPCARHPMPPGTGDSVAVQGCSVSVLAGSVEGTNQSGGLTICP